VGLWRCEDDLMADDVVWKCEKDLPAADDVNNAANDDLDEWSIVAGVGRSTQSGHAACHRSRIYQASVLCAFLHSEALSFHALHAYSSKVTDWPV